MNTINNQLAEALHNLLAAHEAVVACEASLLGIECPPDPDIVDAALIDEESTRAKNVSKVEGVIDIPPLPDARVRTSSTGKCRYYTAGQMNERYREGYSDGFNAALAQQAEPVDQYGSTDLPYEIFGADLTDGDKRLMRFIIDALGNDHPAYDDLIAIIMAARCWKRPANPAAAPEPLHITMLVDWLSARYRAAGGKEGITDLSAFAEEVVRWTEASHGIGIKEQ